MKKMLFFIIAVAFSYSIQGQEFKALDKSPLDMIEYPAQRGVDKVMRVLYSRPQLKGREFNKIVSNGKLWRTGANETTEITFYKSMNFGGKSISAGSYSLYTIPGKDKWTVVINSENGYFGIVQPDESNDLFSFEAFPTNLNESVEQLTIDFVSDSIGSSVRLRWDLTEVLMPFK